MILKIRLVAAAFFEKLGVEIAWIEIQGNFLRWKYSVS